MALLEKGLMVTEKIGFIDERPQQAVATNMQML